MKKYHQIYNLYKELYYQAYGVKPVINYPQCSKILMERTKDHSENTICRIMKLYFQEEPKDRVFHLPTIMSAYFFNKYLPKVDQKLNPMLYSNAEEYNNSGNENQ